MADKGIVVKDADTGESVACRDSSVQDETNNDRIVQIMDIADAKSNFSTPIRVLNLASGEYGDPINLEMASDVKNNLIAVGEERAILLSVIMAGGNADSKVIITPMECVDMMGNIFIMAIMDPKVFIPIRDNITGYNIGNLGNMNIDMTGNTEFKGTNALGYYHSGIWIDSTGTKIALLHIEDLEFQNGIMSTPFDITTVSMNPAVTLNHKFIFINDDASIMMSISYDFATLYQMEFTTPGDLTTLNTSPIATVDISGTTNGQGIQDVSLNSDGTILCFIAGNYMLKAVMDVAWNVTSTITWTGPMDLYSSMESHNKDLIFIVPSDNKFLIGDKTANKIHQYSVDLNDIAGSISYDQEVLDITGTESYMSQIYMTKTGGQLYICGGEVGEVHYYELTNNVGYPNAQSICPVRTWKICGASNIGFHVRHDTAEIPNPLTIQMIYKLVSNYNDTGEMISTTPSSSYVSTLK